MLILHARHVGWYDFPAGFHIGLEIGSKLWNRTATIYLNRATNLPLIDMRTAEQRWHGQHICLVHGGA